MTHARDLLGDDATDIAVRDHLAGQHVSLMLALDLDLSDHPHRLEALQKGSVPVFLLSPAWLGLDPLEYAGQLCLRLPSILTRTETLSGPSVWIVPPPGQGSIRKRA